jgi:diaminopimelate decarboxylase
VARGIITEGRSYGLPMRWLNLGGGLGITYKQESPQTPQAYAEAVVPLLKELKVKLILEPGRFIVGNTALLATEVLYVKPAGSRHLAVVDAGMNDLLRPALYEAYHEVVPIRKAEGSHKHYDVVGPICESADVFARDRLLGEVASGTQLAILSAGAYGLVMASNYNGRPRPAEVLVAGKRFAVIRKRETFRDLIRWDCEPRFQDG